MTTSPTPRPRRFCGGFVPTLAALGTVVLGIGVLAAGRMGSARGVLELRPGQTAREFSETDGSGRPAGSTSSLGFGVRLDGPAPGTPEFRFYVYRRSGGAWEAGESTGLEAARQWGPAGSGGASFRLLNVYPDFELRRELRDVPDGQPALEVQTWDRDSNMATEILLAGVEGRDEILTQDGRTRLQFAWDESQARVSREPLPERHLLGARRGGTAGREESIEAKLGSSRSVAGGEEITALEFFPDYAIDPETKLPASVSAQPNNPALKLSVRDSSGKTWQGFVLAKDRGRSGPNGTAIGPLMVTYRYQPARPALDHQVVVLGEKREVLDYRGGALHARTPLDAKKGEPVAKGVTALFSRISASAKETEVVESLSDKWRRPVAEVEFRGETGTQRQLLKAALPFDLGGDEALVFMPVPDVAAAGSKRVVIEANGVDALHATLDATRPLAWGGFLFTLPDAAGRDPALVDVSVERLPAKWPEYAGSGLLCLGVLLFAARWLGRSDAPQVTPG